MSGNQRLYPRFSFDTPVGYQRPGDALNGSLATNISIGGIKLSVHEFVPVGTVLEMMIHVGNPPQPIMARGVVMWVSELPASERFEVGIQFQRGESTDRAIGDFIRSRRFDPS